MGRERGTKFRKDHLGRWALPGGDCIMAVTTEHLPHVAAIQHLSLHQPCKGFRGRDEHRESQKQIPGPPHNIAPKWPHGD